MRNLRVNGYGNLGTRPPGRRAGNLGRRGWERRAGPERDHGPSLPASAPASAAITQDQAAALLQRLEALERRNGELEKQLHELKGLTVAGDTAIRKDFGATKTTIPGGRPAGWKAA